MTNVVTEDRYPDLYNEEDSSALNNRRKRLYTAVLYELKTLYNFDPGDKAMKIGPGAGDVKLVVPPEKFSAFKGLDTASKVHVLAVYGRLLGENMDDPALGRDPGDPRGPNETMITDPVLADASLRIVPRFVDAFTQAEKQHNAHRDLYNKAFCVLRDMGRMPSCDHTGKTSKDETKVVSEIFARQLSQVIDRLVEDRVGPDTPQLRLFIEHALGQAVGGTVQGRASAVRINLPELEEELSVEILDDNVRALSVLYFSAQLEDMRFFQAADTVAEQFLQGQLPLSRGSGGDNIWEFVKGAGDRMTEVERRGLYSRAFGFAQGGVDEELPNREFSNLWIRALSAVSTYSRQLVSAPVPGIHGRELINLNVMSGGNRIHHMQVYKTLRDLAVNLSLHGYGVAHFAAVELQDTIRKVRTMLSHKDLLTSYGVRDYFQLIERVSRMYLGSEVSSIRQRVQAQSGSQIIAWLSDRSAILSSPTPPQASIFLEPQLVDNVEKWLAVTGTGSSMLEQYSQPVPAAAQPTIPAMARVNRLVNNLNTDLPEA